MTAQPLELADILRAYTPAFLDTYGDATSPEQRRVLRDLVRCRTAELGGHVEECDRCGHRRIAYNSCCNRHCPKCQAAARAAWLEGRQADLLPVPYFHVVFTLPAPIAEIAYQNKAAIYGILFKASAEALLRIAADPKHLGARIGITSVLHSWGSAMTHHPHVHMIVPGGGPSADGERWIACRPGFLLPVRVSILIFSSSSSAGLGCGHGHENDQQDPHVRLNSK
jgi:hypothetical protein